MCCYFAVCVVNCVVCVVNCVACVVIVLFVLLIVVTTGLDRPRGYKEVEASKFQDIRHMKVVRLSALRTGRFYPQEIFLVLFLLEVDSTPGIIVRP